MPKYWLPSVVAGLLIVLCGCGGSNSSQGSTVQEGGTSLSQYQATMPDGSVMELEVLANDSQIWSGEYAVSAETGPYAHQDGTFDGTINGASVTMNCANDDGTFFTMTGTSNGDNGFTLTRSDIPGTTLIFTTVTPAKVQSHADVSFNLNVGGTSSRCVISNQPYSSSGSMTEYRGTWQGLKVTFWSYNSGYASIVIQVNDLTIDNVNLSSYRLTDFSSVTKAANNAYINVYNPATKAMIQFAGAATCSP